MSDDETRLMTVVEARDAGVSWSDIAEAHGIDVNEAMQRYRDQAYDHWDTGWHQDVEDGQANFETGALETWLDAPATVSIEEVREYVPLDIVVQGGETSVLTGAELSPEQARGLAAVLEECADIAEGQRQ
jgi:hypothetical protein